MREAFVLAGIPLAMALASFVLTFPVRMLAKRVGAVAEPTGGRRIHTRPIPQLGGLAIGVPILIALAAGLAAGWFTSQIQPLQVVGFALALSVLMIGGFLDDKYDLSPKWQVLFPACATLLVMATGTRIGYVTDVQSGGPFVLGWLQWPLTFLWLMTVSFAMKFFDGLDGLVTGQTVIGAGLIAALAFSSAYFQPMVGILALIVAGAFLGFLPANLHPAKQFLGESGSMMAGFALGFLAIVAGAKVATALMALGLPLADASLVVFGRLARGASPFRGDDTHLHFKLLKAGLSQRKAVAVFWSIALLFGAAAFGFQSKGKLLLLFALVATTVLLSYLAGVMKRSRIVQASSPSKGEGADLPG